MAASTPEYSYARGVRPPASVPPAEETFVELRRIDERRGGLTAEHVADDVEATGPTHRLAGWFTWDRDLAVRKLHVLEAGTCIRSVVVTNLVPDHVVPVRALVPVQTNGHSTYEPINIALRQHAKRQQVLNDVQDDLDTFMRKMRELIQLCNLMDADP